MIVKVQRTDNYSVMARATLEDMDLSFRARGVWAYLMSKPSDWTVRSQDLQRAPEGRDAIRSALNELREAGLAKCEVVPGNGSSWTIYETPDLAGRRIFRRPKTSAQKSGAQKPVPLVSTDKPSTDKPSNKELSDDRKAEAIYEIYPKKVGKPAAIKAIKSALKDKPFEELLKLTSEYNKARQGSDHKYTPHPSTFYNQQRYNDDKGTWRHSEQSHHGNQGTYNNGQAGLEDAQSRSAESRAAQAMEDLAELED